jgi:xanthosine utilization system XapX-like protein
MTSLAQGEHTASLFNVVGYLLGLSFFVSTATIVTQRTTRRELWLTLSASFALLVLFSIVTASRTSIALYISFLLALAIVRFCVGLPIPKVRFLDVVLGLTFVGICFGFILYVFNCRAEMSGVSTTAYMNEFAPFLGAESLQTHPFPPPGGTAPVSSVFARVVPLVGMALLYFTHSAFIFSEVSYLPPEQARVLFSFPLDLLARTGLISAPNGEWKFVGRSLSLPGELFHDYRLAGLIVGSVLLGLIIWFGIRIVRAYPTNLAITGLVGLLITIAILSPIHSAFDFLPFPFACFTFLFVPMVEYIVNRLGRDSLVSVIRRPRP